MSEIKLVIILVIGIAIAITIECGRQKYIKQKIDEGTKEKLNGNEYKIKYPPYPQAHIAMSTKRAIQKGIDKNITEIHNSQNTQEPKQ